MTVYSPQQAPSTAPAWIVELRARLAAEKKAAEAEKARAKQARIQIVIARKRRTRASRREQFIQWFARSLEAGDESEG
jgi:hypothetical protein